jgi:high-affinity Fe2+/Pb2+ permease
LKGLFGWSADPEKIRVLTYFAYLLPVLVAFVGFGKRQGPRSASAVPKSAAAI